LRGETGWRDVWTIPAGGGQPVEVTNDVATAWNPVWSPDRRSLYFGSDGGGSPDRNLMIYSLETKKFEDLGPADPGEVSVVGTLGALPVFLEDGKRILLPGGATSIFDLSTRRSRPVAGAEGLHVPTTSSSPTSGWRC
jgi:Tol biopolymer transport system component